MGSWGQQSIDLHMSKGMGSDRILTKGLILKGAQEVTESTRHLAPLSPLCARVLGLFCWYLCVWEIRGPEKTLAPILIYTNITSEHRNESSTYRWAVPVLTETWLCFQHHLNISLLALQKPAGNLTRTGFPGSLLTSCFCSHPEIGNRKQKHGSEHPRLCL